MKGREDRENEDEDGEEKGKGMEESSVSSGKVAAGVIVKERTQLKKQNIKEEMSSLFPSFLLHLSLFPS